MKERKTREVIKSGYLKSDLYIFTLEGGWNGFMDIILLIFI